MYSFWEWRKFADGQTPSTVVLSPLFYERVRPGERILDFGSAWGRVPLELQERGYEVVGFDINQAEVERAQGFARETNQHFTNQVRFDVADALDLPYADESFEVCLMQAFLTTLVEPECRRQVIAEAWRVLVPQGLLYLGVFGQTWENPKYRQRYDEHFPLTGERGTFIVTEDSTPSTPELYRVHHYSSQELQDLLKPGFDIDTFRQTTFTSYHGNRANGFVVLAKKRVQK